MIVASATSLISLALTFWIAWQYLHHPSGELYNKREWSIVQALQAQREPRDKRNEIVTRKNVFGDLSYDAFAIPSEKNGKAIWFLSNSQGLPQIKSVENLPLRRICEREYDDIKNTVRLNPDVDSLLRSLMSPKCSD